MALFTDINDLLNKRKVEDNRIEFKRGWNPENIYHSICAFANDIDNLGGGYILVGVEEENGVAQRPVLGLPESQIDAIQKAMHGFNQKINPYYLPRTSVENVDGKYVLVIWVPTGVNRPYSVPVNINTKGFSKEEFYIRSGSTSIPARGEVLDELRDMASRLSFDERPNPDIKPSDISITLLSDYLDHVHSSIPAEEISSANKMNLLDQMELLYGPSENRMIRNVAAMMFSENPQQFFPYSQVEVVIFPEGRIQNPDSMIEVPPFIGPITKVISDTLSYLRTNVIKERIVKPANDEHSIRYFNYPYQALEEAVVNAMYHRDYQVYEPVEITIEPDMITILSFSGPDLSIPMDAIRQADSLKSRRYRNRHLGEFFKELELTEGRATGIPTIQRQLKNNGSPRASIETDENRTYFMIEIPCHKDFVGKVILANENQPAEPSALHRFLASLSEVLSQDVSQDTDLDFSRLQILSQDMSQDVSQDVSQDDEKILADWLNTNSTKQVWSILKLAAEPSEMRQLQETVGETNKRRFALKYIKPLISIGWLEMTIPDKPTSKLQRYRLTTQGKHILSIIGK